MYFRGCVGLVYLCDSGRKMRNRRLGWESKRREGREDG